MITNNRNPEECPNCQHFVGDAFTATFHLNKLLQHAAPRSKINPDVKATQLAAAREFIKNRGHIYLQMP